MAHDGPKFGELIVGPCQRDATHLAVAPTEAAEPLAPGQWVGLREDGRASSQAAKKIGIVDPFLKVPVKELENFWLFLKPGTVTSLRHEWEHPSIRITTNQAHIEPPIEWKLAMAWMQGCAKAMSITADRLVQTGVLQMRKIAKMKSPSFALRIPEVGQPPLVYWRYFADITGIQLPANAPYIPEKTVLPELEGGIREDLDLERHASVAWLSAFAQGIRSDYAKVMDAAKDHLSEGGYLSEGGKFEGMSIPDEFWDHYEKVTGVVVPPFDPAKDDYETYNRRGNFLSCSC